MAKIDKSALVAEIEKRMQELRPTNTHQMQVGEKMDRDVLMWLNALTWVKNLLNTLEEKEEDQDLEIDNNNHKITVGTKIRSKTNPNIILSIISDDCHGDEFECSNGSVLSLKQIEKYYDLIK